MTESKKTAADVDLPPTIQTCQECFATLQFDLAIKGMDKLYQDRELTSLITPGAPPEVTKNYISTGIVYAEMLTDVLAPDHGTKKIKMYAYLHEKFKGENKQDSIKKATIGFIERLLGNVEANRDILDEQQQKYLEEVNKKYEQLRFKLAKETSSPGQMVEKKSSSSEPPSVVPSDRSENKLFDRQLAYTEESAREIPKDLKVLLAKRVEDIKLQLPRKLKRPIEHQEDNPILVAITLQKLISQNVSKNLVFDLINQLTGQTAIVNPSPILNKIWQGLTEYLSQFSHYLAYAKQWLELLKDEKYPIFIKDLL
ncbi:MAG TPA: hypothetical protein VHE99_07780 [Gammaproteobacteria bacterium]|nr:hypothetical protein [Gammaproteobacteria bacterium]